MFMQTRIFIVLVLAVCFAYLLILPVNTCSAEDVQPELVELTVNKSFFLPVPRALIESEKMPRVTIGDKEIADFELITELDKKNKKRYLNYIYIVGNKPGVTNMSIWKDDKLFRVYDIEVTYDILRLKQKLHDILPDEEDIRVFATKDSVVLSGAVSSAEKLSEALSLANSFIPEENRLVNLLKVSGVHQVMLEVKVAEMSKSTMDKMGINFSWANAAGEFGIGLLAGLSTIVEGSGGSVFYGSHLLTGTVGQDVSADASGLFRFNSGSNQWTGIIDILKQNGLVKILAEPNLIAISGQTASFLAGGEYPVPVPDEDGITIEYKPFGIMLGFTPIVLSEKKIQIKVEPEVSELDWSSGTTISGAAVPGITTRKASTTVELADGQSFAIAGLLKENTSESISKFPVLGDIPVLGALFKSKYFQKNETELIIIVTPHLVKPLDMARQSLPTDYYIEPDDAEFYFWGMFGKSHEKVLYEKVKLDGEFGHIINEKDLTK